MSSWQWVSTILTEHGDDGFDAVVFFEHLFVREKEYGISTSSVKTNKISIPGMLSYASSFLSLVLLLKAPLK